MTDVRPVTQAPPRPVPRLDEVERLPEWGSERTGLEPLDRNERLAPLPERFLDALRAEIASPLLTEYTVLDPLYEALAAHTGLPRERLLLTSGSDAAFKALFQCYVEPGDTAAMLDPSYAMYSVYADVFGARTAKAGFDSALEPDADALLAGAERARITFIANPNQPTGTVLDPGLLREVIERAGGLVVVDEAYFPFSGSTAIERTLEHGNLVVTRTLSKAYGLAGLRVGFAAAHPDVIATLFKVRSVYDVTSVSAAAARIALTHPEVAEDYVAEVDAGREALAARASALGLEPLPSRSNFMLIRVPDPAAAVAGLRERGFLVKGPFGAECLAPYIRVTLGPAALMERFADALGETVGGGEA